VGLEAVQAALARLYTDDRLRERFFAAPGETAAAMGLAPADAARVVDVDRGQVEAFAESLKIKRYGEVRDLVPRARAAIGEEALRERFLAFASAFLPSGVHKHAADALAFADALGDAGRFDRAALGLFWRLEGTAARPRRGLAVAFVHGTLLVRWPGADRYRGIPITAARGSERELAP
jgi:hypothetical protein